MTRSAGSIKALSGDLKCLCLGESLNIYATSRFILENELYSSQGKAKSVETAMHEKFEETSKPSFRSQTGPSRLIFSVTSLFGLKGPISIRYNFPNMWSGCKQAKPNLFFAENWARWVGVFSLNTEQLQSHCLPLHHQVTSKKPSLKFQLRNWKHLHRGYSCFTEDKR